ncbi:MAG: hypothetical protein USCGTAYLOR_02892 [Chromatiales bacterium USCg_Taylor]|nr:MAG: hypothetical protein USCGTAYLOR_02892 [Chromatiales bacterium USCg_Taylor]
MTRRTLALFAACVWLAAGLWPSQSRADTDDSFLVRNALDIVTLCSVAKEGPLCTRRQPIFAKVMWSGHTIIPGL